MEPAVFILYAVLWAVPLLGLATSPLRAFRAYPEREALLCSGWIQHTGWLEYYVGLIRDGLALVSGLILVIVALTTRLPVGYGAALFGLVALAVARRRIGNRRVIDHLIRHPDPHPDDLFRLVWQSRSVWPPHQKIATRSIGPGEADFTGKPPWLDGRYGLWLAFYDTTFVAGLVMQAANELGGGVFRTIFDTCARLWSTRTASHLRLRLVVTGHEELSRVRSQAVIVLTHESMLDFCLSFYAMAGVRTARGTRIAPRFMAAKDHFIDNVLIHHVLGLGRAMKASGMVFVDRKTRGKGGQAIDDAVTALRRDSECDLAIFPQGTRAKPHVSSTGELLGAGYYTTARGGRPAGHVRRGAAAIAARLVAEQDLDLVAVGVVGTASVVPARSLRARTHRTVHYAISPPLHFERGADVDEASLTRTIDLLLRRTAQVNERLLLAWQHRTGSTDAERDSLAAALSRWEDADDPIPFATLDEILSGDESVMDERLRALQALALAGGDDTRWAELRRRVVG